MGLETSQVSPTEILEVGYDRDKFIGWCLICILFIVMGVFLTFVGRNLMEKIVGYFCALYFGAGLANNYIWPLLHWRSPVITITSQGIRDTRIAAHFIPWNAIGRISTFSYGGMGFGRSLVLALKPGATKQVSLTWFGRLTRILNPLVGVNGLVITTAGLKTDYETLFQTTLAYARAHNTEIR
jgi:hypothetical protein